VSSQVHGADEPYYERSRLSAPVIFFTHSAHPHSPSKRPAVAAKGGAAKTNKLLMRANTLAQLTHGQASGGSGAQAAMSRTKKELVTALIAGQQLVQIEKLNGACQSHGTAEDYL
jgi:hypothetical protein